MAFDSVFQGPPVDVAAPGTRQSPSLGVDVTNKELYLSFGQGWQEISGGGGSGGFTTLPDASLIAPNGGSSYSLGATPIVPAASFYFVNGIKRVYGTLLHN